ncbi:putative aldouronate transport system substrate-binding protein [Paenibacillus mucilaginosus]|uniref:extracellular solute-binding protein n=1 Tax=Paenibacillus mucilaginosus TaxID=61624 RepID=UPI003D201D9E
MNRKPITPWMLTLALGLGTITACSNADEVPAAEGGEDGKPAELTFFMNTNLTAKTVKGFEEVEAYKEIQKRTGTKITFQQPGDGSQFNIMLASGTYPDIVYAPSSYPGGFAKLVEDGVAIKLNDLIEQHAPNYKKILNEHPEIRKQVALDDGTIAKFPQIDIDLHRIAYSGQMVREDWLNKVGLKAPKTIDEWYTALKAFKEKDPNGNGQNDEIPLGDRGDGLGSIGSFATGWGLLADKFHLSPATGKVTFGPLEPGYKDYLTTMNKWFKEGLIDSEFAATDRKAFDAKFVKNTVGAYGGVISGINSYKDQMKGSIPDFKLIGLPPAVGPAGKSYSSHVQMVQNVPLDGAFVSSQAKDPAAAVKLLDYMIGPEGSDLQNWGIEGKSYKVENGKKVYTDEVFKNPEGFEPTEAVKKYALPTSGMVKVMDFHAWAAFELRYPEAAEANETWFQADRSLLIPPLSFSGEESQKLGSIMSEVNTYVKEMWIKFIMGSEPLAGYDQFTATLKKMGIEEAIRIQQAAYDRYQKR